MTEIITLPTDMKKIKAGHFWFSQRQKNEMKDKHFHTRDKTFCSINGHIMEYTELIEAEEIFEDQEASCEYEDAKYLGIGFFHHFEAY